MLLVQPQNQPHNSAGLSEITQCNWIIQIVCCFGKFSVDNEIQTQVQQFSSC